MASHRYQTPLRVRKNPLDRFELYRHGCEHEQLYPMAELLTEWESGCGGSGMSVDLQARGEQPADSICPAVAYRRCWRWYRRACYHSDPPLGRGLGCRAFGRPSRAG